MGSRSSSCQIWYVIMSSLYAPFSPAKYPGLQVVHLVWLAKLLVEDPASQREHDADPVQ